MFSPSASVWGLASDLSLPFTDGSNLALSALRSRPPLTGSRPRLRGRHRCFMDGAVLHNSHSCGESMHRHPDGFAQGMGRPPSQACFELPGTLECKLRVVSSQSLLHKLSLVFFAISFFLPGLAIVWGAVHEWRDWESLSQSGLAAQARVTRLWIDTDADGSSFEVAYEYEVERDGENRMYQGTGNVDSRTYNGLAVGAPVSIRYAATRPSLSMLIEADSPRWALRWVFIFFAVAWNGAVVAMLWMMATKDMTPSND